MIPIPPAKPKATVEKVLSVAGEAWRRANGNAPLPAVFVLAVRSYYSRTIAPEGNNLNAYDDAFFIVTPAGVTPWNGNTDPGRYGFNNSAGKYMARLMPGCWWFRSLIHRGKYQAFGQGENLVTVERVKQDGNVARTETGCFGINLHLGGVNGTSSEGCCTLPPEQWEDFRKRLNQALALAKLKRFAFVLVDGPIN